MPRTKPEGHRKEQTSLQAFCAKTKTRRRKEGTNFSTGFLCQEENQKEKEKNKLCYRLFVPSKRRTPMEAKTLEENILMHGQQVATECSVTHWRRSDSGQTWAPATCCGRLAFCCGAGHTHRKLKQNVFFLVFWFP